MRVPPCVPYTVFKAMSARPITQKSVLSVLIAGFSLVILLLLAAAFVGVTNVRSIRQSVAALVTEQGVTTRLFGEIEREQAALNAIFYKLAGAPAAMDRQQILAQLHEVDLNIQRVTQASSDAHTDRLWLDFQSAARNFSTEARRVLADPSIDPTEDLFQRHQEVISIGDRLSTLSYQKSLAAQRQIEQRSATLVQNSAGLLGACLLLALLCAILTMRMATQLIRQMEQQSAELSRVSWHMLENQETTARRFSHELHDELGQSLTAVKANLLALQNGRSAASRVKDCLDLVDEAIRNVRELAQLMRPTILDDFGLDAGLRWLGEGFHQRTGIDVDFRSNFEGRLTDESETHLFRIAQEALTNVARHSQATRVSMELRRQNGRIGLLVSDNGRGMEASSGTSGMGITGMRARARISGGEMSVDSKPGNGVRIEVWLPAQEHETKDSHFVGR
jgi:signal transduction histidine kinase